MGMRVSWCSQVLNGHVCHNACRCLMGMCVSWCLQVLERLAKGMRMVVPPSEP